MDKWEFKKIKLEDMVKFIEKEHPEDKKWFKQIAFDANGRYQHLIAVREFCKKYMPDIVPVAKTKTIPASDLLKDW